jgi:ribonuclease HI
MKTIELYTDGCCLGNPGPGGWCCLLRAGGHEKVLRGGEAASTNNRMEIMAVLAALRILKEPCRIQLYADSRYVLDALKSWIHTWARNGWRTAAKGPVANRELWEEIYTLMQTHRWEMHWVKGHSGHPENEFCDQTAKAEAEKFR